MSLFDSTKYTEIKEEIESVLKRLHALAAESAQQAGVLSDPVDSVATMLICVAVGMLRGYRPDESKESLHERLTAAVAEGLGPISSEDVQ